MKHKYLGLFLLLLALAGMIGWLLPVLAVRTEDGALEGKAEPVTIRQVDLNFQSDLSPADKLRLMRRGFSKIQAVELEHGIFLTDREVQSVLMRFLRDLTGSVFDLGRIYYTAAPLLLSFDAEGSVLVWEVQVYLDENWRFEAMVDDETGLLLRCMLSGPRDGWESLFRGLGSASDARTSICTALGDALCAHCGRQLSAEFTVSAEQSDQNPGEYGEFLLSENGQAWMRIPFLLMPEEGFLSVNPG